MSAGDESLQCLLGNYSRDKNLNGICVFMFQVKFIITFSFSSGDDDTILEVEYVFVSQLSPEPLRHLDFKVDFFFFIYIYIFKVSLLKVLQPSSLSQ